MSLITIEQLLEYMDLDFEPRWVTKDKNGAIWVWDYMPKTQFEKWLTVNPQKNKGSLIGARLKISEFDGKDWTECIYEVPRKTTGEIKKIEIMPRGEHTTVLSLFDIALKVNEIIDKIETLEERTEDVCARIIEVERAVYPVQN